MQIVENENPPGEKKHRSWGKGSVRILLMAAILFVVLAVVYLAYCGIKNMTGTFTDYAVIDSIERNDGVSTQYTMYNGAILKYSQDGATAYNADGEILWSGSYEMQDPIIDICDAYVAIADRGSTLIHIFNGKGTVNEITTTYSILKVQVANQGVVAVLMEDTDSSYIVFYNGESGEELVSMKVAYEKSGYGVDIGLSDDGQKLVTSFLDVSSGSIKTNVAYYNFSEVGENYKDHLTLGSIYSDLLIPKVDFLDNDIVCIYRDDGFEMYEMEQTRSDTALADVTFDQDILSTVSSESYVGFILDNSEEEDPYRVVVYDLKGKKVLDTTSDFNYTSLSMSGSDLIFQNGAQCEILNVSGRIRLQYTFTGGSDGLFGTEATNRYFLIQNDSIEVIKLKGAK